MATRSLGTLTIDVIAKTGGFQQGMDRAAKVADDRMKRIEAAAKRVGTALGLAITAATGTIGVALKSAIDGMDELSKAAQRAGVSTETFSGLAYAAKLADVSVQDLQTAFGRLAKAQADALDEASEQSKIFRALGISITDATGKLRNADEVFAEFADAFKRNQGSPEILAAGMAIFGRSFQNLVPLLKDGSDGLRSAADEARSLGQVISTEAGRQAEEFNDNLTRLVAYSKGLANTFAQELLPSLVDITGEMVAGNKASRDAAEGVREFAKSVGDLLRFGRDALDFLERFRVALVGLEKQGNAAFQALNPANWTRSGLGRLAGQYSQGSALIDQAMAGSASEGPGVIFIDPADALERDKKAIEEAKKSAQELEALRKLAFGGRESKSGGGSKKSEAELEAERLQQAYESLMGSMRERIALFNKEGEAAKVRYDVEFGSLKALDDARKQALITEAEQYDLMVKRREEDHQRYLMAKEETDRIRDGLEAGKEMLADLQFELELMKMTNAERATAIQLRGLEAEAVAEYGEAIAEANRKIEAEMEKIHFMDQMRYEFSDFFEDVIGGTKSISDAFKDMLSDISKMILRQISRNLVESLFGQFGSSGGGAAGNWLGSIAGLFSGGKAAGGMVYPQRMYEVNEAGMEMLTVRGRDYLLTGGKTGNITPAHQVGAGRPFNQVVNVSVPGRPDKRTPEQIARAAGRESRRAMARTG